MRVRQFRYTFDNFAYLIYGKTSAMAVDGGAVEEILAFVKTQRLDLKYVTNTHQHADHTLGTQELVSRSGAEFIDNRKLADSQIIDLDDIRIHVYHTPGHTRDSVCFYAGNMLISGDTLFNGTVGNCFSGDLAAFHRSIKKLMALPDETLIYAGHDYVKDSMRFAKSLEPDNPAVDEFLREYQPSHVVSTLAQELLINPYLKFNADGIVGLLRRKGLPVDTESQRWESLMSIE